MVNTFVRKTFGKISSISADHTDTWSSHLFLTFDIDWAHDDVLRDTISLVEEAGVAATWFMTHETPLIDEMRLHSSWELGIHPNFNPLMEGASSGKTANEVIADLMTLLPGARSVRSHSLLQSNALLNRFASVGLTHDANHFVPSGAGIGMRPWKAWNGLVRVPFVWEDDVFCMHEGSDQPEQEPTNVVAVAQGIMVFNFHPIHVFLNTESLDRYERTRPLHYCPDELIKHRYVGYGTRNRLLDLLSLSGEKAPK